jgi:dienelactone hydrolase
MHVSILGLTLFLFATAAHSQASTPWPNFMAGLKPSISTSLTQVDLDSRPFNSAHTGRNDAIAVKWSGLWTGWGCRNFACDAKVKVLEIGPHGAKVVFGVVGFDPIPKVYELQMQWLGEELVAQIDDKFSLALRLRSSGDMEFLAFERGGISFVAGLVSKAIPQYVMVQHMVPTPLTEAGQKISLEVLVFKPKGNGSFPTLIMNHGSTGRGDNKELAKQTWSANHLTTHFLKKGWQVVYPQRRGRGQSGGIYNEGLDQAQSRYSCVLKESLVGLDRAVQDMDVITDAVLQMEHVDKSRIYIGGQSRGGLLALAYAAQRPELFKGVINFVGGWMNDQCSDGKAINREAFIRGSTFAKPTLWLYGQDDTHYSLRHMRENFDAYKSQGGQGEFFDFRVPGQMNGHWVIHFPELWDQKIDIFLDTSK